MCVCASVYDTTDILVNKVDYLYLSVIHSYAGLTTVFDDHNLKRH